MIQRLSFFSNFRALPAAGLYAHTAQALTTLPVSAAIPNADLLDSYLLRYNTISN
ncbi:hypothetical protein [Mucilaginibacter sp.]|uniref:hypothetical protein n=1 Tax=Mucilaginibacter sp. TaxID=1882438 RepID=UPI00260A4E88|nr:hypothetical protein [Mucilaginibacter sp.]MDB5129297.1 hypothetical protein [Mucilaginibacter sp.]